MLRSLTLIFTIALVPALSVAEVRYDRAQDRMTVTAQAQQLSQVLGDVADSTGMKIFMDPAVDKSVDVDFKDTPLSAGLKRLTRGMNVVLIEEPGKPSILKLLPVGQAQSEMLRPLGKGNGNSHGLAAKPGNDKQFQKQQRLEKLSPQQREIKQAKMEQRDKGRKEERAKNREAKRAEKAARRAQHDAARAAQLARLQVTDPAVYEKLNAQEQQRLAGKQQQNASQPQ